MSEEETKHAGGRPTKMTPELMEKARKYLPTCVDELVKFTKQVNEEKGYEIYENRLKVNLPSIAGFALWLNISRDTVYEWGKEPGEFSDILGKVQAMQEKVLLEKGLSGDYNSTIAKLILAKHGHSDKVVQDITSGGKPIKGINYIVPKEDVEPLKKEKFL